MAKKARIEDIDSDAVINSFRMDDTSIPPQARSTDGSVQAPSPEDGMRKVIPPPASRPKEEPERRRRNGKPEKTDYDGTFVCEANVTARLGKQVYIRKEVTIASFLDNVLTHHFTQFQEEIAESFRRHMESYNL